MTDLVHITEEQMRSITVEEGERAKQMGRSHIMEPEGFAGHLIATGNTAEEVAHLILEKNPRLEQTVNPLIARTTGYFHDFGKIGGYTQVPSIEGGDAWHDIDGPYMALTRNDELGLIDGTPEAVKDALRLVALGITSDFALVEELGSNFPETALYRIPDGLEDRIAYLRSELSTDGNPISWAELTTPTTTMRKIGQYADMVSVGGGIKELHERMSKLQIRYKGWSADFADEGNSEKADYFASQAELPSNSVFMGRFESTIREVDQLAGLNQTKSNQ